MTSNRGAIIFGAPPKEAVLGFVGTPFLSLMSDDDDEDLIDDSFEDDVPEFDALPYEPDDEYNPYETLIVEDEFHEDDVEEEDPDF